MPKIVMLLTIISSIGATNSPADNTDLKLVQVVFREGERAPRIDETYPNEPTDRRYETWTPGHLTEIGQSRAHRLGLVLARRYGGFLGNHPERVYAYTVDRESCRQSLKMVLLGLFGPEEASKITINGMPEELDALMNLKDCSSYKVELAKLRSSAEVLHRLNKYDGLYEYIMEKTGLKFENNRADETLYELYNLLEARRNVNLTLPDWCPEGVLGLLNEIVYFHYNLESHTESLQRLNGGPLVRRFLETAKRKEPQVHLYSGEGRNLAAFIRAHGRRYPRVPNSGSAFILEKRGPFVRILVWTGVTEKLFPMQLKGCPELCPIDEYTRIVSRILPTDEEMRCLLDHFKSKE